MPSNLDERLPSIIQTTNERLWACYKTSQHPIQNSPTKLIFPRYCRSTSTEVRVSEREATFCFAAVLEGEPFQYAVEVPTKEDYQFMGKVGRRSALIDLAIYTDQGNKERPALNVEFKGRGITEESDKRRVEKDVNKVLHEGSPALWFHVLEHVNRNTVSGVFGVLASCIWQVSGNTDHRLEPKAILFNICILEPSLAISKTLSFNHETVTQAELQRFFEFGYTVGKGRISITNPNGWTPHHPDEKGY